jgi:hypothetical protein
MEARTSAQLYALVFGVVLVAAGIIGFFYEASFAAGAGVVTDSNAFGILAVNGWHNLIHLLTGAIGLAVVGSVSGSRTYALVLGVVYVLVAIWGFASPPAILSLVPVNVEDDILHLLIGIAGLGAYAASSSSSAAKPA